MFGARHDPPQGSTELLEIIRSEIRRDGPIPFERFMELALYDNGYGYYTRGPERIGPTGDFVTASDSGHAFGRCLARQILEIDRSIGSPDPFHVLEFGAGRGLLARDLLDAAPALDAALAARLRYRMIDRSRTMRERAAGLVPEAEILDPAELRRGQRGCVLAVELFDALPVHRVRRRQGQLLEVYVDTDADGGLREIEAAPTEPARELAERYGAAADEGSEAEVTPRALDELDRMAGSLERGVIIVVDYGERSEALYGAGRPQGTLLAYHAHETGQTYLRRLGEQDLTAHVNFSALEDRAREIGLGVLGLTTQDRFLIANGILEDFEPPAPESLHDPRQVKRRLQAMQLIHPEGMGRRFKVLLLSKGWQPQDELNGLRDPFARRGQV